MKYRYTPRRSGRAPVRQDTPRLTVLPLLVPVVLVIGALIAIGWLSAGGGAECNNGACDNAVAAAASGGASPRATAAAAAASPQPTRRHSSYPPPQLTGLAAAVLEEPCGARVYGVNDRTPYPPASLAKLMTALVAARNGDLSQVIKSPIDGGELSLETDGTIMGIALGEKLTLRDLLYGLLMRSGNDAALVIAESIGGSEAGFVRMMNAEARGLGLTDTHFTNAHGLDDPGLYTSAYDIAYIGHEVLQQAALAEIVATRTYTPDWDGGTLENINLFLTHYPGAIGVKTGYTDTAGQTIVAAATRDGRTLVASVLHSEDEYVDAGALLDWAFDNTSPACP